MSTLLLKAKSPDKNGRILNVSPETAKWKYVGFQVYQLKKGQTLKKNTNDMEVCLVILTGIVNVKTNKSQFNKIGKRMSVFEKTPPYSVYVP